MSAVVDITGQTFGRALVIRRAENAKDGRTRWDCRCVCGSLFTARGKHLRRGEIVSCGCFQAQRASECSFVHGASKTRLYKVWAAMKQRCENPKNKSYKNYGARGIRVCAAWSNSFEQFLADMGERPAPDLSIERINNNGHYEPSNCKWATDAEQRLNKRPQRPGLGRARERARAARAALSRVSGGE